jgi:hypothetical protein
MEHPVAMERQTERRYDVDGDSSDGLPPDALLKPEQEALCRFLASVSRRVSQDCTTSPVLQVVK